MVQLLQSNELVNNSASFIDVLHLENLYRHHFLCGIVYPFEHRRGGPIADFFLASVHLFEHFFSQNVDLRFVLLLKFQDFCFPAGFKLVKRLGEIDSSFNERRVEVFSSGGGDQ